MKTIHFIIPVALFVATQTASVVDAQLSKDLTAAEKEKYQKLQDEAENEITKQRDFRNDAHCPKCMEFKSIVKAYNSQSREIFDLVQENRNLKNTIDILANELNLTANVLEKANAIINETIPKTQEEKMKIVCSLRQYPDESCVSQKEWLYADFSLYPIMTGNLAWVRKSCYCFSISPTYQTAACRASYPLFYQAYYTQLYPSYYKQIRGNPKSILLLKQTFTKFKKHVVNETVDTYVEQLRKEFLVRNFRLRSLFPATSDLHAIFFLFQTQVQTVSFDQGMLDTTHFAGTTSELQHAHAMAIGKFVKPFAHFTLNLQCHFFSVDVHYEYFASEFARRFGQEWVSKQMKKRRLSIEDRRWEMQHAQQFAIEKLRRG